MSNTLPASPPFTRTRGSTNQESSAFLGTPAASAALPKESFETDALSQLAR